MAEKADEAVINKLQIQQLEACVIITEWIVSAVQKTIRYIY